MFTPLPEAEADMVSAVCTPPHTRVQAILSVSVSVMAHFHQRTLIRIPNPIATLYYEQLFPLAQIRIQIPVQSFRNGYNTHFRY